VLGILVHGDNHFIVEGPAAPDLETALRLAWRWEVPQLGVAPPPVPWRIITKAFREDLVWAIVLEGDQPNSPAVQELLAELAARGVPIQRRGPSDKTGPTDI
jgi:hypothetical protein